MTLASKIVMRTLARHATIAFAASVVFAGAAQAQVFNSPSVSPTAPTARCTFPPELARFEHPLKRTTLRITAAQPVKIVAIGSSSTFGEGASSPAASYPARLSAELHERFPGRSFTIVNRGVNGDNDHDKRARFERDVIAQKPDAVLWQLGTNSMLGGDTMETHLAVLQAGVAHLRQATGADIVLIDPQYAPKVLSRGEARAAAIVTMIAKTASGTGVNLFRRYELMRRWRMVENMAFDKFLSPDEFHMNDWSYACVARALGDAMEEAVARTQEPPAAPSAAR